MKKQATIELVDELIKKATEYRVTCYFEHCCEIYDIPLEVIAAHKSYKLTSCSKLLVSMLHLWRSNLMNSKESSITKMDDYRQVNFHFNPVSTGISTVHWTSNHSDYIIIVISDNQEVKVSRSALMEVLHKLEEINGNKEPN